jgi:hypothetical protein
MKVTLVLLVVLFVIAAESIEIRSHSRISKSKRGLSFLERGLPSIGVKKIFF